VKWLKNPVYHEEQRQQRRKDEEEKRLAWEAKQRRRTQRWIASFTRERMKKGLTPVQVSH
jgi:hypothetical protein